MTWCSHRHSTKVRASGWLLFKVTFYSSILLYFFFLSYLFSSTRAHIVLIQPSQLLSSRRWYRQTHAGGRRTSFTASSADADSGHPSSRPAAAPPGRIITTALHLWPTDWCSSYDALMRSTLPAAAAVVAQISTSLIHRWIPIGVVKYLRDLPFVFAQYTTSASMCSLFSVLVVMYCLRCREEVFHEGVTQLGVPAVSSCSPSTMLVPRL